MRQWAKENKKRIAIVGIMADEGGARVNGKCMSYNGNKLKAFQPLMPVTKKWENWFIDKYDIELADLYYPPYNLERTGCKGCPFALHLQQELDMLEKFFQVSASNARGSGSLYTMNTDGLDTD